MTKSIRWRFAFTLAANLLRALLGFLTGMLLARWLGPDAFGNMAFLLGTFVAVRQVLDLGSSSAFFTFLSQGPKTRRFVGGYFLLLTFQFIVCLGLIGLIFPERWIEAIWHGQDRSVVALAFGAAFLQNSFWPVVQQVAESQRQTAWVQGIGTLISVGHLAAVLTLAYFDALGLPAVFIAIMLEYVLGAIVAQRAFLYAPPASEAVTRQSTMAVFRRYREYCGPLLVYSVFGFAYDFADRWLLQRYGGAVEQSYYAVGSQFAAIALIATTSILRIFWKEVAEAHAQGDEERTGRLYRKVTRSLFFLGAIIAGYLAPWSGDLLGQVLGGSYLGGTMTLAIMFIYPVHQSMGQIGGTMLLATERVALQVKIGIAFMLSSMVATYFVLAPRGATVPGLGLASVGLAVKMGVMQILQVNAVAYFIAREYRWQFDWIHQPVSLLGCLALGWAAHALARGAGGNDWPLAVVMGLGGLLYFVLIAGYLWVLPWQSGLSRTELRQDFARFRDHGLSLLKQ